MPTLSITFSGLTGRGPFSLAAISFSQAVPVKDQIEVVKNGTPLGAVAYSTAPGTTSLVLAAGYDLVPSDTLVVNRVTDQVSLYSQYSAYGNAPAEGTIQNSQQALFILQELQDQVDTLSLAGGAPAWGDITGTLSSQTDLWSALQSKALATDLIAVSDSVVSLNGTVNGIISDLNTAEADIITNANDLVTANNAIAALQSDLTNLVLNDLANVSVASATNGQVLTFTAGTWVPTTPSGGGGGATVLSDLTDVNTAGVTDGQVLAYDNGSGTWLPTTISGAGAIDGGNASG